MMPSRILLLLFLGCGLRAAEEAPSPVVLFAEDFNGATLQHAVVEFDPNPGVPDWAVPELSGREWSRGNDRVTGGTFEWLGWSFTTTQFWIGDEDQARSTVFPPSTTEIIAVADSDEAEDRSQTPNDGYNAYLRTPTINLTGFHFSSLNFSFDSNFRAEEDERSLVHFFFDEAAAITVDVPDQSTTLTPMTINLSALPGAPASAASLWVEFAHIDADNNWWWAIDNVLLTGNPIGPAPGNQPPVVSTGPAGPARADLDDRLTYTFSAVDPEANRVQLSIDWGDGSSTMSSLVPSGQQVSFDHTWSSPNTFDLQVRAVDEHGAGSTLTQVQSVNVTGEVNVMLLTPPYLQNVRTNGIVIMCESQENQPLEVQFGPDESYGQTVAMTRVSSGGGTWFHRALLDGLEAGTHYHYQVTVPEAGPLSEDAVFETAPLGAPDFEFSVWGDSQGHNHGVWRANPLEPTVSMMKHMVATGVKFGLGVGDMAESGASYTDTRQFYLDRVARHLGTSVPWFVAWGNHDSSSPNAPLRLASDMPSRYRPGFSPGHGSFSFMYADCFFVCIDHFYQQELTNGWLESQLASPEAQQARFRFLGIHVPPYCERWIDGSSTLRNNLVPLLERYRVNFCFSGHTHEYERGELNHVHYVITGGGSWLDHTEPIVRDWEHIFVGGSHNVQGSWATESSLGVLGPPQPIVGGLFNEYALISVRDDYLKLETYGFNADGSLIGVLDAMEIGTDPATDADRDGLPDSWEVAHGLNPNDPTGVNGGAGDFDGDGLSNEKELLAGTLPNDATSVFAIRDLQREAQGWRLTWFSRPGQPYFIETSRNLDDWESVMQGDEPLIFNGNRHGPTSTYLLPDEPAWDYVRVRLK